MFAVDCGEFHPRHPSGQLRHGIHDSLDVGVFEQGDATTATIDERGGDTVDQDHPRARNPSGAPGVLRPGQRRTVGLSRVGSRQDVRRCRVRVAA